MGKRSNFPRIDKDHYPTIDPRAIQPLLAHLPADILYAEPMAGEGHLIDLLRPHARLAWASTIDGSPHPDVHENDVLNVGPGAARMYITNPVWRRPLLHKLIVYLSDQLPTWLLFDSNWANTKQAARFMPRCRKIVAVGRLTWMEGTNQTGKDDCSWYLFDKLVPGSAPMFYGRGCLPANAHQRAHRICPDCGALIDRHAKWGLKSRNGVSAPVHDDCSQPTGAPAEIDTSLLEWGGLADA